MGIFTSRKTILELKRKDPNGKEVDLDKENGDDAPDTDYSMGDGDTTSDAPPDDNKPADDNADPPPDDTAPDDTNNADANADDGADDETNYTMDDGDAPEDDGTGDDNGDDTTNADDGSADDTSGDDMGGDTNYSMDDDGSGDGAEDDGSTDDGSEDTGDDTANDAEENVDPDEEMKNLEKELNSRLNNKQINIQNVDLKKRYIEIYNIASSLNDRIEKIPKNEDTLVVIDFCLNKILELKQLIYDYLTNAYDTKTYPENSINIKQYLVTLTSLNKLLKEIKPKKE